MDIKIHRYRRYLQQGKPYITNLIHASVDPKTVQYLAGHENSKITMDIYAKVKYNKPDELVEYNDTVPAPWVKLYISVIL